MALMSASVGPAACVDEARFVCAAAEAWGRGLTEVMATPVPETGTACPNGAGPKRIPTGTVGEPWTMPRIAACLAPLLSSPPMWRPLAFLAVTALGAGACRCRTDTNPVTGD